MRSVLKWVLKSVAAVLVVSFSVGAVAADAGEITHHAAGRRHFQTSAQRRRRAGPVDVLQPHLG